jgi:hypothetical protein
VVSVSVDNQADVYFNGRLIGTTKQWTQTGIFKFSAPCGTPGVLAIHGKDTGGPAAILASWTHCGVTTKTDLGCKCTSKAQKNWNQLTFDDSQWTAPSDAGINGADPWGGKPKIDPQARWIWSGDNFDTNEAYCRCTEGHLGSSGSGLDGSGQFHLRVDDTSSIFVNGKRVGETTARMWREVKSFAFNAPCSSPTVYAVDGSDKAGVSAFIGDINHCGEAIQTLPNRWKCSTKCPNGWEGLNFDDSAWSTAVGCDGRQPGFALDLDSSYDERQERPVVRAARPCMLPLPQHTPADQLQRRAQEIHPRLRRCQRSERQCIQFVYVCWPPSGSNLAL